MRRRSKSDDDKGARREGAGIPPPPTADPSPPSPEDGVDDRPRRPLGERAPSSPFTIVGIGASAGGLEAVSKVLSALPSETGMAFVVVLHLDPNYDSRLPELLSRQTRMPVVESTQGARLEPDHVFVITPGTRIAVASGVLHVTPRPVGAVPQLPIDLLNLLSGSDLALLMVGADQRIRRFTKSAGRLFGLAPSDLGGPVRELLPAWPALDLEQVIGEVIEHVRTIEREVQDREGSWWALRVHPYRTSDHRIDGAVLVLVDIDQMRRDQEDLRRQATLLELSRDAIIVRDCENRVLSWNRGAADMYGWEAAEARGKSLDRLLRNDPAAWAEANSTLDSEGYWEGELGQLRRDQSSILVHSREALVRDEAGTTPDGAPSGGRV